MNNYQHVSTSISTNVNKIQTKINNHEPITTHVDHATGTKSYQQQKLTTIKQKPQRSTQIYKGRNKNHQTHKRTKRKIPTKKQRRSTIICKNI